MLQKRSKNNRQVFQWCGNLQESLNQPPQLSIQTKTPKISLKDLKRKRVQSQKLNSSKISFQSYTQPQRQSQVRSYNPKVCFSFNKPQRLQKDNCFARKVNSQFLANYPNGEKMIHSEPVPSFSNQMTSLGGILDKINSSQVIRISQKQSKEGPLLDVLSDNQSEDYNQDLEQSKTSIKIIEEKSKSINKLSKQNVNQGQFQRLAPPLVLQSFKSYPNKLKANSLSTNYSSQISALRQNTTNKKLKLSRMNKSQTLMSDEDLITELLEDVELIEDYKQMFMNHKNHENSFTTDDFE